ncbi:MULTISPECIES: lipopolysaccharide biosynthesis protein [Pseudovibrio]|uniref:lipopolysaccharide biosynthesis protein n=1 Tax=Stappiaceae TaxID=2821832 RepID=UPI0023673B59|nr:MULTISPECIES: lipopolysaccharide biosynthesis protein [Pseudovibrio]MDD7909373.1 lipopolysaccharide biosynthesis protein [Pseudovibrio exalbescens]MDX5594932.1 lipopolysaccharide biosynthesis protein [Pseudovibrio sp. SPO723]
MRILLAPLAEKMLPNRLHALLPYAAKVDSAIWGTDDQAAANRGALIVFFIRVASAALAYALQVFLARFLGGTEYGIFVTVWTLLIIFSLFSCFGFSNSVLRFIPEYEASQDHGRLNGLLYTAKTVGFASATLIAGLGALLTWALSDVLDNHFVLPLLLMAICLPITVYSRVLEGIARAYDWQLVAMMPIFIWRPLLIILAMVSAWFLGFAATATTACLSVIFSAWAVAALQTLMMHKRLKSKVTKAPKVFEFKYWLLISGPMLLVDGFFQLITSADVLMVGYWLDPHQVGIYFAASRTLALLHFVFYAVRSVSAARLSRLYHSGNTHGLHAYTRTAAQMTFYPTLLLGILLVPVAPLLLSLFGSDFTEGLPALYILILGVLARASLGPADALLIMSGNQMRCAWIYAFVFAVNVALNVLLIPQLGLMGAALSTTLAIFTEAALVYSVTLKRLGVRPFFLAQSASPAAIS